jgi:glutamyl-Q tRNA(Asp) synthetase
MDRRIAENLSSRSRLFASIVSAAQAPRIHLRMTLDVEARAGNTRSAYRGRFAPSPTGPLHLGSLLAAIGSWLMARHADGEWLVRIEDVDTPRCVEGIAEQQLRTLAAFGLESDLPVLRQSHRQDIYRSALQTLLDQNAAFPCRCSRNDLRDEGNIHRKCREHPSGHSSAVRLRVPDGLAITIDDRIQGTFAQQLDTEVGDFVLFRADGLWAYQLAVVVDDAAQQITHVVRGADLLDSAPRQRYLQQKLAVPETEYAHLPLVLDVDGRKLSKSSLATPVTESDPLPAMNVVWRLLGQVEPIVARNANRWLQEALRCFEPNRIPRSTVRPSGPVNSQDE